VASVIALELLLRRRRALAWLIPLVVFGAWQVYLRLALASPVVPSDAARPSPIPLFVATAPIDPKQVRNLQEAFRAAIETDDLKAERDMLLLADFVIPLREPYEALRRRAEAAERYPDQW